MPMPRMLKSLKDILDVIEETNDWEFRFVSDLLEKFENDPEAKLTDRQFSKLVEVYETRCGGR